MQKIVYKTHFCAEVAALWILLSDPTINYGNKLMIAFYQYILQLPEINIMLHFLQNKERPYDLVYLLFV